jgi:leucyl aminopeptidase
MITIKIDEKPIFSQDSQGYIIPVEQDFELSKQLQEAIHKAAPEFSKLIKSRKFTGKSQSSIVIPFLRSDDKLAYLILVGLGKKDAKKKIDIENFRRAIGKITRIQEELKIKSYALQLPMPSWFGVDAEYLAEQAAQMIHIASYHFDTYITDPERKVIEDREITLAIDDLDKREIAKGVKNGEIIAQSVNDARHWIDLPPSQIYPGSMVDKAKAIAKKHGMKFTSFSEKEINAMGMGGLAAVSRGSELDCELSIIEYKTSKKNAPTIAFVGKGITFDSGGLSIKPAVHMETMKEDMSGAAAVIATMDAIGALKPSVNVIGITPLAENLPSGKATKPGEIVRFYNGKTAEIKNTDAEGRLILADALSYAVEQYKPDAIIDVATLTGSCAHALGPFYCGLMSDDDALVEKINEASARAGDRVWRLPLHDDYKPAIKSAVADLSNIGSQKYLAGAITAALFLQNFVDDTPWAHLDIAGVAFDVPDLPYYRTHSATGFGVRLLVDLAMRWQK